MAKLNFDDVLSQLPPDPEVAANEPAMDEELTAENDPQAKPPPFDLGEHYWALYPYMSEEFAREVTELFDEHVQRWMGTSTYSMLVFDAYRAYHGLDGGSLQEVSIRLDPSGEQGELLSLRPNNVRSLLKHQIAMVTADRPAWEPQANNANADAQRQVPMVRNLLDYALSMGLHKDLVDQFETQKVCAEGYLVLGWDANLGLNKKGWFTSSVVTPWEMCHQRVRSYGDCSWWVWRTFENRMDWVAKFASADPERAEKIFHLDQSTLDWGVAPLDGYKETDVESEGDRIAVLNVFVRPSASCPQGRLAKVVGDDLLLSDGPSPFGDTNPVSRMCGAEFVGTAIPYADSWMLIAPAEAINVLVGTMMTRVDTFGVPSVAAPAGSELQSGDFGGANLLEMGVGEKPTVLDLLNIPDALPKMLDMFEKMLENFSGVNSVTRGSPQENVSSGSMAALLQAMAIQYNSSDERAWGLNLEQVGTKLLRIFQTCASSEVMVAIAGKSHTTTVEKFKGEDISSILQVSVRIANALSKTTAGKMQIAESMLQGGMIKSPAEYDNVLQTGQLESLTAGPTSHLQIATAEREMVLRGESPSALLWDNHLIHLQDHVTFFNTDGRYDMQKCQVMNAHCQEHMNLWQQMSREQPDFCAALGIPVLPQSGAIGDQGRAMTAPPGAPPPQPAPKGPPPAQQHQPNTDPVKAAPGPKAAPPGPEQSQAAPKQPTPAKTPAGQPVV